MIKRKGLDKPIFIIASLVLAMLFVAFYYSAVSGWLGEGMEQAFSLSKLIDTGATIE